MIRLPEYIEIRENSYLTISDYEETELCIEIADGNPKRNNRYQRYEGHRNNRNKPYHSSSGKFHINDYFERQKITESISVYQFNVEEDWLTGCAGGFRRTARWLNERHGDVPKYYTTIRATLLHKINHTTMKSHIHSNELKIWHNT